MIGALLGLLRFLGLLSQESHDKQVGDAAVTKAELSDAEKEIKAMREDKDFSDKLTAGDIIQLRDRLNNRP